MSVNTVYDVPAAVPPKDAPIASEFVAHAGGSDVVVVEELGGGVDVVVVVEWLW